MDFIINNFTTILFYLGIGLLIYYNRRKFEFQGIVGLYKTKFGIRYMKIFADKYPRLVGVLATIGIWVGFIGMFLILAMVVYSVYQLIYNPSAPPAFTPVFPGFQVPGGPRIPLVQGILALFIVVVIHEFAHGVVSKLHKIKIRSSGFAILGPIPAAFVEPDQKVLEKASPKKQLGIYAAGPFSNVLLGIVMVLIINLGVLLTASLYAPGGAVILDFNQTDNRLEAFSKGDVILALNNETVSSVFDIQQILVNKSPGEIVLVETNKGLFDVELNPSPVNESRGYIGFTLDQHLKGQGYFAGVIDLIKTPYFWVMGNPFTLRTDPLLGWIGASLIGWIYILTLGIGLVNLLPIGPVDGGRMIKVVLDKYVPQRIGNKIFSILSYGLVLIILILLIVPILRNII